MESNLYETSRKLLENMRASGSELHSATKRNKPIESTCSGAKKMTCDEVWTFVYCF